MSARAASNSDEALMSESVGEMAGGAAGWADPAATCTSGRGAVAGDVVAAVDVASGVMTSLD